MVKTYAGIMGAVLLLLGIGGLLLGDRLLLGLLNIDLVEDLVHVASGILFLIAASQRSAGAARGIVGAVSVVYLLAAVLGFVAPYLFGLLPDGYSFADNLVHAALGILGLLVYANSRLPEAERGAANPRS
jgi:hypothetical protein